MGRLDMATLNFFSAQMVYRKTAVPRFGLNREVSKLNFFNAVAKTDIPDDVRYIPTEKFGKNDLVWQAICSCGMKVLHISFNQRRKLQN